MEGGRGEEQQTIRPHDLRACPVVILGENHQGVRLRFPAEPTTRRSLRTVVTLPLLMGPQLRSRPPTSFMPVAEPLPASLTADELTGGSRLVTLDLGQVRACLGPPAPHPPSRRRSPEVRPHARPRTVRCPRRARP